MNVSLVSIAQAKNTLPQLIHDVENGKTVQFTRHGRPAAVLVSVEMFSAMNEARLGFATGLRRFLEQHQGDLLLPDESALLEPDRHADPERAVNL